MKEELVRANQLIATEQQYSKDLRIKYEVLQQKEDQNLQAIDNLQRRISLLLPFLSSLFGCCRRSALTFLILRLRPARPVFRLHMN